MMIGKELEIDSCTKMSGSGVRWWRIKRGKNEY
jgi:hypothetical protein